MTVILFLLLVWNYLVVIVPLSYRVWFYFNIVYLNWLKGHLCIVSNKSFYEKKTVGDLVFNWVNSHTEWQPVEEDEGQRLFRTKPYEKLSLTL